MNENIELIFASIFVLCVLFAMISDLTGLRIPNIVSIVLIAAFAIYALLGGTASVWAHVVLAGVVFVILFTFFALGWVGAGDVKFLSALTLWAGPAQGALFIMLFAIFSGAFALMLLALRKVLLYYPALGEVPVMSKFTRLARLGLCPFSIPMGIAALCVAPSIFPIR